MFIITYDFNTMWDSLGKCLTSQNRGDNEILGDAKELNTIFAFFAKELNTIFAIQNFHLRYPYKKAYFEWLCVL